MSEELEIRDSAPSDLASLEKLYPDAFPDENLLPLVKELLGEETGVLSLVAIAGTTLVGHCIFTQCGIDGTDDSLSLLGPLAVATACQKQGVGSTLVRTGLQRVDAAGAVQVNVLGDPAYYGRFGFAPDELVSPPYALPEAWRGAWQSIVLRSSEPPCRGQLTVPRPWRQSALWTE